jgi:two-component system sensor histidine kinase TctE
LHEMLSNLLDNALRYTPEHGQIAIRLSAVNLALADGAAYAQLVMEDSGPGIPVAEREKVFEPFYRALAAGDSNPGGTGLGLSIVRDILNLHQGQIRLSEGANGKGLRLELLLPM